MANSCESKCGKSILISFTLVHWLAGAALLLLGGSIILDPTKLHLFHFVTFDTFERDYGLYLAYGLMVIGLSVFTVCWIGCCATIKENRCLLVLYFVLLFVLLIGELTASSMTIYYRQQWMVNLEGRLRDTLLDHYGNHSNNNKYLTFSEALDYTQFKFGCCGITDHTDYQYSKWRFEGRGFPEDKQSRDENPKYLNLVPRTCCRLKNSTEPWVNSASSPMSTLQRDTPFGTVEEGWQVPNVANQTRCQHPKKDQDYMLRNIKGCYEYIAEWFYQESTILITVGYGTAALQVIGMGLTFYLFCQLTEDM